jgi:hypothetical protein
MLLTAYTRILQVSHSISGANSELPEVSGHFFSIHSRQKQK